MYENARWIDFDGQHTLIRVFINGQIGFVPLDPENSDYQNIMKLVEEGKLVIAPADE